MSILIILYEGLKGLYF